MAQKVNVGIIGHGFMGRAHSNAYGQVGKFFDTGIEPVMKVACGRNREATEAFARNWGWQEVETDWRCLVESKDVEMIDICSPNNSHYEIAMAAADAGKMIACEKPLAMNSTEAYAMTEAVKKAGVPNMVWYNYRRIPAITLAKQVIEEGRMGRIFHYRSSFLQDWTISPEVPMIWRLDKDIAGSGVSGDLVSHLLDTARYLIGDFSAVTALTKVFVEERDFEDAKEGKKRRKVEIDDACLVLAEFANGAVGTFEATRYARGNKAVNNFEVNGEKGSIRFDLEDMMHLKYFDHDDDKHLQGFRNILVTGAEHPYMAKWWVPGLSIGYEHTFAHQLADFFGTLSDGGEFEPDFEEATRCQLVLDAILEAASSHTRVPVRAF